MRAVGEFCVSAYEKSKTESCDDKYRKAEDCCKLQDTHFAHQEKGEDIKNNAPQTEQGVVYLLFTVISRVCENHRR